MSDITANNILRRHMAEAFEEIRKHYGNAPCRVDVEIAWSGSIGGGREFFLADVTCELPGNIRMNPEDD